MKVKIVKVSINELVSATIRKGRQNELPSMHQGWNFSFDKHIRTLANATAYILTADETPDEAEGCMIFQIRDKLVPYMAFVEIAPHNRADPKKYDHVAGCLIAYASRLSLDLGKNEYEGWLSFQVSEEKPEDQIKLMAVYSKKYGALRYDEHTMFIGPDQAAVLIKQYL